jgi:hypothetical protein
VRQATGQAPKVPAPASLVEEAGVTDFLWSMEDIVVMAETNSLARCEFVQVHKH